MPRSVYNGAGYVMSDNRASGGTLLEDDVLGCGHCQASISKTNWRAYGENKCSTCDEPVCSVCKFIMAANGGRCSNFKMMVEKVIEAKARLFSCT